MVERLEAFLPSALVEVKRRDEARVAKVEMDDKDRHVLAAALAANADLLLTQNVRHFPRDWMAKRGIELIDAGTLLTRLADDCPDILRRGAPAGGEFTPADLSAGASDPGARHQQGRSGDSPGHR